MNTQSTLTKKSVVDQLTAQLAARRTLQARRTAAYYRLAQQVLGTTEQGLRPDIVPVPLPERLRPVA